MKVLSLDTGVTGASKKLMDGFRQRIGRCSGHAATGPATPSSGFVAVYMLMYLCRHVSVFGFGADPRAPYQMFGS